MTFSARILFGVVVLASALAAVGQENRDQDQAQMEEHYPVRFGATGRVGAWVPPIAFDSRSIRPQPEWGLPMGVAIYDFVNQSDWPDYANGTGNMGQIVGSGGSTPRDHAAVGMEVSYLSGGGCFPPTPGAPPNTCLQEPDATGTPRAVQKERERWILRFTQTDQASGTELKLNDWLIFWNRHLSNGTSCISLYNNLCLATGVSLDSVDKAILGFSLGCARPLNAGYEGQLYYQYSRYPFGEVPAGEDEWVPATIPATTTKLDQPGLLLWHQPFGMMPGEAAFSVHPTATAIRPSIPLRSISLNDSSITNVGGRSIDKILAGRTRVVVEAKECGVPFPNVVFNGTIEHTAGSGGHVHSVSTSVDPPSGAVSNAPSSFEGTTNHDGLWQSPFEIEAGEFAGRYQISASTPDLRIDPSHPWPATAHPVTLSVAFSGFRHISNVAAGTPIRPVGNNNTNACGDAMQCDNHKDSSHFGHPWLLTFIESMAYHYTTEVDPTAVLPINDMSLPTGGAFELAGNWSVAKGESHVSHRHGVDVDVNRSITIGGRLVNIDVDSLTDIVEKVLLGKQIPEGPIHYRMNDSLIDVIAGGF